MNPLQTLATGFRGVLGHRLRSILTCLGMLFGVAAVICTVGIGQASSDAVSAQLASLGTNLLTVSPGSTTAGGVAGGGGTANTLTMTDVKGLSDPADTPDVAAVAPVVQARSTLVDGSTNWSTTVNGSTPEWLVASSRRMAAGNFFTAQDVSHHAQKIVLGSTTAADLGAQIGDAVSISSGTYTVVGVLNTVGGAGFQNPDDLGVVPITTAQDQLSGGGPNSVSRILLFAKNSTTIGSAYQEADQLLLNTHGITNASAADFTIQSQNAFLTAASSVTQTLTILLASVAAIALLVGGIGVMNIMLVSVTERTGEIGLRKALGAAPGDLLRQFLVEAVTLTIIGGALGVGGALLAGKIVPRFTTINMTITLEPVLIAVGVAAAIGLVFGVYPAARAAKLAPIEALRAE